jgi:hypothetical protein
LDAKGLQSHLGYDPREDDWPEAFAFSLDGGAGVGE